MGNFGEMPHGKESSQAFTQSVGTGMFGRDIHILFYTDASCTSTKSMSVDLTNHPQCFSGTQKWGSFKLSSPSLQPSKPDNPSCNGQPDNKDDNTVTLRLSSEGCTCGGFEDITLGKLDECHDANGPFQGFMQTVGQNLFGRSIHVLTYASKGCSGGAWVTSLSNNDVCYDAHVTWQSLKIVQGSSGDSAPPSSGSTSSSTGESCSISRPKARIVMPWCSNTSLITAVRHSGGIVVYNVPSIASGSPC